MKREHQDECVSCKGGPLGVRAPDLIRLSWSVAMGLHPSAHGPEVLQVAQIVPCTEAEGPGRRFALWFQGCPLRCPGCCNPEMLPFAGGQSLPVEEVVRQITQSQRESAIEGITLLGGEPFAHSAAASAVAGAARARGLTVMVFSGHTLAELCVMSDPAVDALLGQTDLLVDGPYLRDLPEARRRWIGSSNQQIHFLTERYRADDPCWLLPNTLEIRLAGGEVTVNGFPARTAVGLWRRESPRRTGCSESRLFRGENGLNSVPRGWTLRSGLPSLTQAQA